MLSAICSLFAMQTFVCDAFISLTGALQPTRTARSKCSGEIHFQDFFWRRMCGIYLLKPFWKCFPCFFAVFTGEINPFENSFESESLFCIISRGKLACASASLSVEAGPFSDNSLDSDQAGANLGLRSPPIDV